MTCCTSLTFSRSGGNLLQESKVCLDDQLGRLHLRVVPHRIRQDGHYSTWHRLLKPACNETVHTRTGTRPPGRFSACPSCFPHHDVMITCNRLEKVNNPSLLQHCRHACMPARASGMHAAGMRTLQLHAGR